MKFLENSLHFISKENVKNSSIHLDSFEKWIGKSKMIFCQMFAFSTYLMIYEEKHCSVLSCPPTHFSIGSEINTAGTQDPGLFI